MLRSLLFLALAMSLALMLLANCGATPEPEYVIETVEVERPAVVEKVVVEAAEVEAEEMVAATPAPEAVADSGSPGLAAPVRPQADRMIIKNAEMELLVADTDVALDSITVIAADYGGYIISSHTWFEDEFKYATIRMGVPVLEFENILRRLRGLALQVTSEIASGEDVTDQYVDLQSRLINLQATRDHHSRETALRQQSLDTAAETANNGSAWPTADPSLSGLSAPMTRRWLRFTPRPGEKPEMTCKRNSVTRRDFIGRSLAGAGTVGTMACLGPGARAQSATEDSGASSESSSSTDKVVPCGTIGKVKISRLLLGGNLVAGNMHSRDLHYVDELFRAYMTEEKILETMKLAEQHGINTVFESGQAFVDRYNREYNGHMQFIPHMGFPFLTTDISPWKSRKSYNAGLPRGEVTKASMCERSLPSSADLSLCWM